MLVESASPRVSPGHGEQGRKSSPESETRRCRGPAEPPPALPAMLPWQGEEGVAWLRCPGSCLSGSRAPTRAPRAARPGLRVCAADCGPREQPRGSGGRHGPVHTHRHTMVARGSEPRAGHHAHPPEMCPQCQKQGGRAPGDTSPLEAATGPRRPDKLQTRGGLLLPGARQVPGLLLGCPSQSTLLPRHRGPQALSLVLLLVTIAHSGQPVCCVHLGL